MKIGGVTLDGPNIELIVFERPTGNIVFKAQTVRDFKEFEALVPPPTAPGVRTKDGFKKDTNAPTYRDEVKRYDDLKFAWMILKSLEPSEIEWEKTDPEKPGTWPGWAQELQDAGLSEVETNRIVVLVLEANSLDEAKMKAAREAFVRGQGAEASKSSGQSTEQEST